jgi:hypothetical protein
MKATVNGKTLTIEIPLQKPTPSKSGKSQIVASTGGFTATTATVDGKPVRLSVNAII